MKEINERGALRFQDETISQTICNCVNSPGGQRTDYSTGETNHGRFKKEDEFDLSIFRADRFHDANLAGALEDGHDHRVGDTKAGD